MSATFDENYKNKMTLTLTVRIGKALKSGELDENELCEVCSYVSVAMDTIKSVEEVTDFLTKISARWPFFQEVLNEQKKTDNTIAQIDTMFGSR
jgi:hypothetical protein